MKRWNLLSAFWGSFRQRCSFPGNWKGSAVRHVSYPPPFWWQWSRGSCHFYTVVRAFCV